MKRLLLILTLVVAPLGVMTATSQAANPGTGGVSIETGNPTTSSNRTRLRSAAARTSPSAPSRTGPGAQCDRHLHRASTRCQLHGER